METARSLRNPKTRCTPSYDLVVTFKVERVDEDHLRVAVHRAGTDELLDPGVYIHIFAQNRIFMPYPTLKKKNIFP